ncbi:proline--tRNA ligase [bacterium]|nr:proline--tRNA ligase [bacterium]
MDETKEKRFITPKSEDFSAWYTDVILKAELADYSPVRGCQVYRPYGFAIWEKIKKLLNDRIIATGHQNTYYPLFIPKSLLDREAEHVKGFAPEVAWVTHGGGKKLDDPLAIRPTSEAIIGVMWAKWLTSYRDLPILENQWANVVRWEKNTRPFLRTLEFLWQEGHTAHRTEEEAREEALKMLEQYRQLACDDLALHVLSGIKSESERFAGAVDTYGIEAMMPDGKALQSGTSHFLGQNFAKAYDIKYLDEDNTEKLVYTTSWGVSHRIMGGMIMAHGDDKGLILPPKVAPIHVVIVPIMRDEGRSEVLEKCNSLAAALGEVNYNGEKITVKVDEREGFRPGYKFAHWELRGVPLRIEVGPRDIAQGEAVLANRLSGEKRKLQVDYATFALDSESVMRSLEEMQAALYERCRKEMMGRVFEVESYAEFKEVIAEGRGFAMAPWDGSAETEARVKEETTATTRVLLSDFPGNEVKCLFSEDPAKRFAYFAASY